MTDTNASVQNGQGILPSIEITEYDGNTTTVIQSTQLADNAGNGSRPTVRPSGGLWKKTRLPKLLKLILLTFVPHLIFGSVMFILGCVSWEIRDETNTYEKPSEVLVDMFQKGKLNFNPMIFTDVFALSCIGIGIEFLFSALSGFLTAREKLKEYVQCHILWLSLTVLSSVLFISSCAFGLRESRVIPRGLAACVYSAIATCAAGVLCIIYNFHVVTYHLNNSPRQEQHPPRNSDPSSDGRTPQASELDQSDTSEGRVSNVRTNQVRHSPILHGRIQNRRSLGAPVYHGRRRRSGQAGIRDRMHQLHPSLNSSGARNRVRRRPILRAQNHYVSIPMAYGRPRVASRSRSQNVPHPQGRRNGGEVPMFVIANHNRYVQELNQSMENLESTANRGSVPGDAFPLINAVEASTITKKVLQKSKSVDVAVLNSGTTPAFLRAYPLHENVCQGSTEEKIEPNSNVSDENMVECKRSLSNRHKKRNNLGYSVVMKTKHRDGGQKRLLKNVRSVDDEVTRNRSYHTRNFCVSAEDAVFQQVELESTQPRHRFICPTRSDEPSEKSGSTANIQSRLKCGYTASAGDFNVLPYSDIVNRRRRNCQTSVSSDSIILKSKPETISVSSQSPNNSQNEAAIEMKDLAARDFGLSPVSNTTPSYENMSDATSEEARRFKF